MIERKNNRNLNEQNFEVYWKKRMEDGGSRIGDRLKKLENIRKKEIVDRGDVGRRLLINFTKHNPARCDEH